MRRTFSMVASALVAPILLAGSLEAQRGNPQPQPQRAPREASPIDLTGYWVSLVTQDWRWRMVTPAKNDFGDIQVTPEAAKVADQAPPAIATRSAGTVSPPATTPWTRPAAMTNCSTPTGCTWSPACSAARRMAWVNRRPSTRPACSK